MSFLEECREAEDESKSNKPKTEKEKIKTAAAITTPDISSEFSVQLSQQQQQIGNLRSQMKTFLTDFQATQVHPLLISQSQERVMQVETGDYQEIQAMGDGETEVMMEGEVVREVGPVLAKPSAGTHPTTELTNTHNTTNTRVASTKMSTVSYIKLDNIEKLYILRRIALC